MLIASVVNRRFFDQQESKIVSLLDIIPMAIRPRVTITLDEEIYKELTSIAEEQERTPANLAAYIVTKAIKEKNKENTQNKEVL
ncbi:MAG: ribbon-helix-helix domain-containing protein [Cuspidothrix sp.]